MKTSCVTHKPNVRMAILRQDYLDLCGGDLGAAFLLSFFEYWHNIKLEQQAKNAQYNEIAEKHGDEPSREGATLYQFHTAAQLYDGLLGAIGKDSINRGLAKLVSKGFITVHRNPNPRYHFDSTKHFLFHPHIANQALRVDGISEDACGNSQTVARKHADDLPESGRISPESSSEITIKKEDKKPSASLCLPDWIPKKEWEEFKVHRKRKKAPLTDSISERLIETLFRLKELGHDPATVLTEAVDRNWTGIKVEWIHKEVESDWQDEEVERLWAPANFINHKAK